MGVRRQQPRRQYHLALTEQKTAHQLPHHRTTHVRVHRHRSESLGPRSVGGSAYHRDATARSLPDEWPEPLRISGNNDHRVDSLLQQFLERAEFPFSQSPVRTAHDRDAVGLEGLGRVQNAHSQQVEVSGNLTGQADAHPDFPLRRQKTGGQIGAVTERLSQVHHFHARHGADAAPPVKGSIHRPNRDPQRLGDTLDAHGPGVRCLGRFRNRHAVFGLRYRTRTSPPSLPRRNVRVNQSTARSFFEGDSFKYLKNSHMDLRSADLDGSHQRWRLDNDTRLCHTF